jgi:2-keto-4-pentenoate hydratase/2-oxohepta-3-ene-1,7-dioic acid hydratase in catechol pathway
MKLVSFHRKNLTPGIGVAGLDDGKVLDLNAVDPHIPQNINAFLAGGDDALAQAKRLIDKRGSHAEAMLGEGQYALRPAVPNPSKFLLMGINYKAHVIETGRDMPEKPVIFGRWAQCLIAAGEPIRVPRVSERVDFEGEFVLVIGREGRYIPREKAWDHVAGYTCFNDVSMRDFQRMSKPEQWTVGKNFDHSGPLGPWVVTADEVKDPENLELRTVVNGKTMQEGNTGDLIFTIPFLIELISSAMTLYPGDLISTGTPGGVGDARKPPIYLKKGDSVTVSIQGIGDLTNPVLDEE